MLADQERDQAVLSSTRFEYQPLLQRQTGVELERAEQKRSHRRRGANGLSGSGCHGEIGRVDDSGDFAIVARGVHALAYLGDHTWIEADPGAGKVIVVRTSDKNTWLDSSAVFVRWRDLDETPNR